MSKVIVVGGGAAGMFAAIWSARAGHRVTLFEKNEKLGKKIYITGKGRCNLTNASDMDIMFSSIVSNEKFLYSSFYGYTNEDVISFFESLGMRTKIERGNRVFPASDHASDVIGALKREMNRLGIEIKFNSEVARVKEKEGVFSAIELKSGTFVSGDACIVATGGVSYPSTGSTGDGYRFAKDMGMQVTPLLPSLVSMDAKASWTSELMGLSLKNVTASIYLGQKKIYEEFGEMLFTHYGVSGPIILSASAVIGKQLNQHPLLLSIDLKPALSIEQLDRRVLREFEENKNKQFKNAVGGLFPSKLIPVMIELSKINPEKKVNEISKEERMEFIDCIKHVKLTLTSLRDYNEAIITKGGVSVKEINPSTMESKKIKGLYFAGEVLDLDALTGGFNLQIAWSTGYAAGNGIK